MIRRSLAPRLLRTPPRVPDLEIPERLVRGQPESMQQPMSPDLPNPPAQWNNRRPAPAFRTKQANGGRSRILDAQYMRIEIFRGRQIGQLV